MNAADNLFGGAFVMKYLKVSVIFIAGLFIFSVLSIDGFKRADAASPANKAVLKKQEAKKEPQSQKKSEIKVTFVELGSVNCIPCKMMQPVMKEIEKEYGGQVKVVFYDVWKEEGRPYAEKYKIRAIPTQVFLDKYGKEFFRHEGFYPTEEIVKVLEKQRIKQIKGSVKTHENAINTDMKMQSGEVCK